MVSLYFSLLVGTSNGIGMKSLPFGVGTFPQFHYTSFSPRLGETGIYVDWCMSVLKSGKVFFYTVSQNF